MPSSRQIFFTLADELAFSEILKAKFPQILFAVRGKGGKKDDLTEVPDVPSADGKRVNILIPPDGWSPTYKEVEFVPGNYGITNYPEESIYIMPSSKLLMEHGPLIGSGPPMLGMGWIMVGISDRLTPTEKSFSGKVWRLVSKIATHRLKAGCTWQPNFQWRDGIGGQMHWAGWDAVRWAFEDDRRVFSSSLHFRPEDCLRDQLTKAE